MYGLLDIYVSGSMWWVESTFFDPVRACYGANMKYFPWIISKFSLKIYEDEVGTGFKTFQTFFNGNRSDTRSLARPGDHGCGREIWSQSEAYHSTGHTIQKGDLLVCATLTPPELSEYISTPLFPIWAQRFDNQSYHETTLGIVFLQVDFQEAAINFSKTVLGKDRWCTLNVKQLRRLGVKSLAQSVPLGESSEIENVPPFAASMSSSSSSSSPTKPPPSPAGTSQPKKYV